MTNRVLEDADIDFNKVSKETLEKAYGLTPEAAQNVIDHQRVIPVKTASLHTKSERVNETNQQN